MNIWLIGTGAMAIEYAKVLKTLKKEFTVIGRGNTSGLLFEKEIGIKPFLGGLSNFLNTNPPMPEFVIIAVGIENLANVCFDALDYGVANILLEKPGVAYPNEIFKLSEKANEKKANVYLAYNRRFYASVVEAKRRIQEDGGVKSFHFEFTEWSHSIKNLNKHKAELETWFLGNSTHVIDTAFYLCGSPRQFHAFHSGGIDWHPSGSVYSGAGITNDNAIFSYIANWESPGRWNLEIMTDKHRFILKPMEKLQLMKIGSITTDFAEGIDYSFDENFKPGLFGQTQKYLRYETTEFCTIEEQTKSIRIYKEMSGYKN